MWSKNRRIVALGRFFGIFGVRPGPQNRQKTSPGAKQCVRRRRRNRVLSFFLAVAVRSRSLDRFVEVTNVPIVYVFIYYAACLGFSTFSVFPTKITKNRCKNTVQTNNRKIMVRASISGAKIDENRSRTAFKAPKLRKNVVFGGYRFLSVFSMHFSMNFGSPRCPRGAPKIDFFASFSDFFARLPLQSCSWAIFGRFRATRPPREKGPVGAED